MDEMKEKCFANGRIIDVEKGCLRPETEIWVEDGRITRLSRGQAPQDAVDPVSYTHLDVYKRQPSKL